MKSRTFISILILVFVVMIIAGSCATGKKASVTKEDEVLFGTWINPDYDTTWGYGKIIIKPDGAYDEYKRSSSDSPTTKWEYTITDKWTDSDGNTFYKFIITYLYTKREDFRWYYLVRIDNTGNVYECVDSTHDFPSEIDPNYGLYSIHYRQ